MELPATGRVLLFPDLVPPVPGVGNILAGRGPLVMSERFSDIDWWKLLYGPFPPPVAALADDLLSKLPPAQPVPEDLWRAEVMAARGSSYGAPLWYGRDMQPIDSRAANELLSDLQSRHVGLTRITSSTDAAIEYSVSTVFLVLDHAGPFGTRPLLFETMVFGGSAEQNTSMWRWCTEAEAVAGHDEIVMSVAATVPNEVIEHQAARDAAEKPW